MIKSFQDKTTLDILEGDNTKAARKLPVELHRRARLLLELLDAASQVSDMASPPGNRLELLKGDLSGFYSVRINDQWRIIFRFERGNAFEAKVLDYH